MLGVDGPSRARHMKRPGCAPCGPSRLCQHSRGAAGWPSCSPIKTTRVLTVLPRRESRMRCHAAVSGVHTESEIRTSCSQCCPSSSLAPATALVLKHESTAAAQPLTCRFNRGTPGPALHHTHATGTEPQSSRVQRKSSPATSITPGPVLCAGRAAQAPACWCLRAAQHSTVPIKCSHSKFCKLLGSKPVL